MVTASDNVDEEETAQQQQQQQQQQAAAVLDRVSCVRPVMFDVFADHTTDPPTLNYHEMVTMRRCLPSVDCPIMLAVRG